MDLTPATSHADDTSVARPHSDYAASSIDGSTIYTPPYTPDGSCLNSASIGNDDVASEDTNSAFATSYFESRTTRPIEDVLLMHAIVLTSTTQPRDLPYPRPESSWLQRDVTKQDWATFINCLIPHHIDEHNAEVADRKFKAEIVDERMQRLTLEEDSASRTDLSQVDAQLAPLRKNSGITSKLEEVLAQWNEEFFAPRCLHIDIGTKNSESSPDDLASMIPGAWATADPVRDAQTSEQRDRRDTGGRRRGRGGWIRADNDGFHVGDNLISADNNGFRMGNVLVADNNGFKLGSLVADSNGFRIGRMHFGGPSQAPTRGNIGSQRGSGNCPGRGSCDHWHRPQPHDNAQGHGERGRSFDSGASIQKQRSHSVSSSSSSSSSESEGSIVSVGSLPDYDHLDPAQLPVAKKSIQQWLEHPDQPITEEAVEDAKQQLKGAIIAQRTVITSKNATDAPASKEAELKALRKEVKTLLVHFKKLKRAQKAKRRAEKRERREIRRAAKGERREVKRRAKNARREEWREAKRAVKGKHREVRSPHGLHDVHIPGNSQPFPPPHYNMPGGLPRGSYGPQLHHTAAPPVPSCGQVPVLPPNFGVLGMNPNQQTGSVARARAEASRLLADANRQTAELNRQRQSNGRGGDNTNRPPIPLSIASQRLWNEAQRIRGDAERMNDDARRTLEQADMYIRGGNVSAEQEKMGLKLREVVEGLLVESEKLDAEAKRLEDEALRLMDEGEGQGDGQTTGVVEN